LSALNRLLTVVIGHFGRKNEYRYLTYTTTIGNSVDRKKNDSINSIFTCKLKALRVLSLSFYA